MHPNRFLLLAVGAFGLAIGSFLIRGPGSLVVSSETAQLLAAPMFLGAFALAVLAFVLAVLAKLGVVTLEYDDAERSGA